MGLSFRAASAMTRELAETLGDRRFFTASGSLSGLRDAEYTAAPISQGHHVLRGLLPVSETDASGAWSQPGADWT